MTTKEEILFDQKLHSILYLVGVKFSDRVKVIERIKELYKGF